VQKNSKAKVKSPRLTLHFGEGEVASADIGSAEVFILEVEEG